MEEKMIDLAKQIIRDTESYILKYDLSKKRTVQVWDSAWDKIEGIILTGMELFDYELEDYPISRLQALQEIIRERKEVIERTV